MTRRVKRILTAILLLHLAVLGTWSAACQAMGGSPGCADSLSPSSGAILSCKLAADLQTAQRAPHPESAASMPVPIADTSWRPPLDGVASSPPPVAERPGPLRSTLYAQAVLLRV